MIRPLLGLTLVGCGPDPIADRAVYLEALALPPAEAAAACRRIEHPPLRGECAVSAAAVAATAHDASTADAICRAVPDDLWRDECTFLAADDLKLTGDDAVSWCNRTGRYRENCLGHAIGREVFDLEGRYGKEGLEIALDTAVSETVARYKPNAPNAQRRNTVERILAQIFSKRWEGAPFDATKCGKASTDLCALAYRMHLDGAPPQIDLAAVCAAGATPEAVLAANAPGWLPGSEAVAAKTWSDFCADLAAGRVVRDGSRSMGIGPAPVPGALPGERLAPPSAVGAQPP